MRNLHELDKFRIKNEYVEQMKASNRIGNDKCGCFMLSYGGTELCVIASIFHDWEHLSISTRERTPTWYEMEYVANLFFKENEIAVQFHVPAKDHVNIYPHVLHWWRTHKEKLPRPPKEYV